MAESHPEASDPQTGKNDKQNDEQQETTAEQELDNLICTTTRKRKICPQKITQQLSKKLKAQTTALDHYVPKVESSLVIPEDCDPADDQSLLDRMRDSMHTLGQQIKTIPAVLEKAKRTKEVLMEQPAAITKTDRVLFRPHKDEAKMAASLTPLRNQLDWSPAPTPSPRPNRKLQLEDKVATKSLRTNTAPGYVLRQKN
ncbi:uncharacterized protein [Branchiostoma lanceolatum]|uniref:uncharacterized protein n=1 Tax=Branchiostoma lanceolatum TaxID=7740 RepID=UPI003456E92A